LLFVAWFRWPRERRALPTHRSVLGTVGLIGDTVAVLGWLAMSVLVTSVEGASHDWGTVVWTYRLFLLCVASFGFSWFCRGFSRAAGVSAGLILTVFSVPWLASP